MAPVPRSLLFTPGSRPDRFAKAGATAAEGLILDLEDAVAEADKDTARANVAAFLADRQGVAQQVGAFQPGHARAAIVNAAACGGVVAIDSPFFAIDRAIELEAECAAGRALGFHGKAAIHPSQIEPINLGYSPNDAERAQAHRILETAPDGVGVLDGKMVDIAMVRWARRVA